MFSFRSLFQRSTSAMRGKARAHRPRPRPVARPRLEALEERTLLNNRFVVPLGVSADNVTDFGSLQSVLTTPGLKTGDVIQIEPGSLPGNVTLDNLMAPAVTNLTIQGDPAAPLATIPQFTISNQAEIPAAEAGLTLSNVNVGLVNVGSLTFDAKVTIVDSSIIDSSASGNPGISLFPHGSNVADSLTNSTFALQTTVPIGPLDGLVDVIPSAGTGCSNIFSNDLFVGNNYSSPQSVLLFYKGSSATELSASHDLVENNTFLGMPGSDLNALFFNAASEAGLTVQNNTFSDPDPNVTGIWLDNSANNTNEETILDNNVINLPGHDTVGLRVYSGSATTVQEIALINNNQIGTNVSDGTGLFIATDGSLTYVQASRNNFQTNETGVVVQFTASTVNLHIDLGGGSNLVLGSSPGANDFRGLPAATASHGPIVVLGPEPTAAFSISAKNNLFSSTTPLDFAAVNKVTVDTSGGLTGNAAFVESLYVDFLQRAGNTSQGGDAFFWVNALASGAMTQAQVVNGICRSQEALGLIVDGLYEKILGRAADAGGQAALVGMLMNGATIEQVTTLMVASQEFANLAGTDAGYVASLYVKLLGRIGSYTEVSGWLSMLATSGRAAVANSLLSSAEYRGDVVQQLYGFTLAPTVSEASLFFPVLHRTKSPMPAEIAGWVNSSQDVLSIEFSFLGTAEFFSNG